MAGLAARCTACGTVFRVVPDQLRVAGGYVRCGRCSAVFNAAESLLDLDGVVAGSPEKAPELEAAPASASGDTPAPAALPESVADEKSAAEAAAEPAAEPLPETRPEPLPELPLDPLSEPLSESVSDWVPEPAAATAAGVPDLADLGDLGEAAPAEAAAAAAVETLPRVPEPGTDFDLEFLEPPPAGQDEAASEIRPDALAAAADAFELDLPQSEPEPMSGFGPVPGQVRQPPAPAPLPDRTAEPEPQLAESVGSGPVTAHALVAVERVLPADGPVRPPENKPENEPENEPIPEPPWRAEPQDQPSFVRAAERSQHWDQPVWRRRLAAGVALGLLVLAGQAVFTWRDQIVARFPGTRPLIEPPCVAFGCSIQAPRDLQALGIESSGLVRVEKSAVYKLQVALRNRSAQEVALPALDITLSDAQGQPLARRVMRAADFGVNANTLAAGRELSLQATLQAQFAGGEPVAGYTIDPFYP